MRRNAINSALFTYILLLFYLFFNIINHSFPEVIILVFPIKNNPFGTNIHFLASKRQREYWNSPIFL